MVGASPHADIRAKQFDPASPATPQIAVSLPNRPAMEQCLAGRVRGICRTVLERPGTPPLYPGAGRVGSCPETPRR